MTREELIDEVAARVDALLDAVSRTKMIPGWMLLDVPGVHVNFSWPSTGQNPCGEYATAAWTIAESIADVPSVKESGGLSFPFIFAPYVPLQVSQPPVDLSRFPHSCPRCGGAAYVGLSDVDCSRGCA